ncbi:MAG: BGTF surface domain-containing protein [Euryarchaeota archaeon]|nr:BGTF surface domain-containing protein [Euryarchaeota archaeon]
MVLSGTVLLTGSVAADGGEFGVSITDVDESVADGEDLVVEFKVENTGDEQATQTIVLEDSDGTEQDSSDVTLGAGSSTTAQLTWENVQGQDTDTRSISPIVRSDDDTDSASVTVQWAEFEIRDFTVSNTEVGSETKVTFDATIRNSGTVSNSQTISLTNDLGATVDQTSLSLDATESDTVKFTDIVSPASPGEYTYELDSGNETQAQTLTVLEAASFGVSIDDTSVEESTFDLVATIENEGDFEDTQPVEFAVDGTTVETRDITVGAGAQQEMTFSYDTGSQSFTADASVETQQPDIATTRITKAAIEQGPSIESVTPQYVQGGEEITVTYTADGPDVDTATLILTDPNGETETVDASLGTETTETIQLPARSELVEGTYDITLEVEDDFGRIDSTTTTNAFEAETVLDSANGDFSEPDYQSVAGDFVEVSVSTGDLGEGYVMIGGDEDADGGNFEDFIDVLHVSGDATFVINTRLVGSDRPSEDVYIPINGDVTSYAHSIGADSEPTGEFEDVSFENDNGDEIAATLAEFRSQQGVSSMGAPLQANRYQLVAGGSGTVIDRSDGVPDFRQPIARSNLVLTQPEIGDVNIYTLPPGSADRVDQFDEGGEPIGSGDIGALLGEATETDRIARGDRILIEVQASGMYGALFDQGASEQTAVADGDVDNIRLEQINTLLERHEGVDIGLSTTEFGGPNHGGSTLQFENVDSSDLRVLPDDTADQWDNPDAIGTDPLIGGFYVVIDTRGTDPFDSQPRDGDELTFDIAYESPPDSRYEYKNYDFASGAQPDPFDPDVSEVEGVEHFPYYGASTTTESANDSFVFEAPYIDYGETTLNGELLVAAESGSVISGETNIAPGSQAEMQLVASNRPNPKTITIEEIEISEDGTFEVTEDFSDFEPGERVEVEFYSQGRLIDNRLIDRRGVRVVDDLDNPATFEIESLTEEADVVRGQRLSAIETTIVNTGEIADRQRVEFTLDGETIRNQSVTLEAGEDVSLDLSDEFVVLPVGEYEYTVRTEDDERSGQLTVTEPDSENDTRINSLDSEGPTVSGSPEGTGDPTESDPEGLFGLFGIRSRDVAVAATVTGAMHLLGQWT